MKNDSFENANIPKHIAMILDGNGRWATQRGMPRTAGHEHGAKAVRTAVYGCHERGITNLTLYAFSAANWSRPRSRASSIAFFNAARSLLPGA